MGNRVTKEIKTFFRLTTFTYKEKTHVTKNWPMLNFESDRHPGIVIQWTSGKILKLFCQKKLRVQIYLSRLYRCTSCHTIRDGYNIFIGHLEYSFNEYDNFTDQI